MRRWEHFDYEERDGVATLTFSRPERLNALTFEVYADVHDLTDSLRSRGDEVRLLVIRGKGRGFCSGGDVDDIIARLLQMDTRGVYEFARMTGACVRNLREIPQPVIAAVNGSAAGAGAVLAAAADIRILAESASFRFLFTSVGISGGDMAFAGCFLASSAWAAQLKSCCSAGRSPVIRLRPGASPRGSFPTPSLTRRWPTTPSGSRSLPPGVWR
jgi:enoyl-CoA hydratase/carnithine racemase